MKNVTTLDCNQKVAVRSLQELAIEFDRLQHERFKKSTKRTLTAIKPAFLQLAERLASTSAYDFREPSAKEDRQALTKITKAIDTLNELLANYRIDTGLYISAMSQLYGAFNEKNKLPPPQSFKESDFIQFMDLLLSNLEELKNIAELAQKPNNTGRKLADSQWHMMYAINELYQLSTKYDLPTSASPESVFLHLISLLMSHLRPNIHQNIDSYRRAAKLVIDYGEH